MSCIDSRHADGVNGILRDCEDDRSADLVCTGERCPLGTVAFDTYGQAGMVGSPIQAKKNAKVVWDGQRFLPANGKEGNAGKRFGRTQMLMKQFKGINKPNEFNSSSSATMYNTKATQQGPSASTYGSMASTYGSTGR